MSIRRQPRHARETLRMLTLYQQFEYIVVMILTALIAVIVIAAVWNFGLKILFGLVLSESFDPSDYSVFQAVFGMIFSVTIAFEFKKSLLVVAERTETVVQIPSIVMIALLAVYRKVIILDPTETEALTIMGIAAVILALGIVYRLASVNSRPARTLASEPGAATSGAADEHG